jgi:hypothetical protein
MTAAGPMFSPDSRGLSGDFVRKKTIPMRFFSSVFIRNFFDGSAAADF